ncbi:hypothetical protein L1049_018944 [Liquidambar formosana]|uniref:L-ascorbate oxidase homolog n=1 Tax=Liquidambar formosana TaxID=63359 RepID=A0AAP0RBQ8_LIQFO
MGGVMLAFLSCLLAGAMVVQGEDPYLFFTWNITYGTISPLGVPQQGILINGQFPGPNINSTTNNNIVINVFNNLDEPFLLSWSGIQHRKNSWQDGVLGTNCPIPPGKNYTYHFQVKDQIGSYYYYPTTSCAQGIRPDGVLINGKSGKGKGKDEPLFTMKPGKTYRYRICNVGIKTSLNFRIQGHAMKLVEMEGSHTVQNVYNSLDVHVGQCYSVLVTANQAPKDYYMVASSRFTKSILTTTAIIRYANSKGAPASSVLPEAPVGWAWSLNQFRSFRWNLTASAARPNPQGSYHYGSINITRTIKIVNSVSRVDGKLRYAINGVSHTDSATPLKLAEYYGVADKVFKYDTIEDEPPTKGADKITLQPNVLNATFRNFVEIIFENHQKSIQSWHLDGYSFFPVAKNDVHQLIYLIDVASNSIEPGRWSPERRKNYNLLDAVSRHTIQVYPKSWAAIFLTFDNAGMWNLRSELFERQYLGQQLYISVLSPARSLRDEYNMPDNAELCGIVKDLPKPPPYSI